MGLDGGTAGGRFLDAAIGLLERVRDEEAETVVAAGELIADTVADGGRLFAFGAGHSSLAAQDLVYRAGGLALMNLLAVPGTLGVDVLPATLGSALERVDGLATAVLDNSPLRAGDLLIVISLSGRNALPVEMAAHARERGVKVIGLTSVAYATATTSRHSSGTFLKDHCDLVLDSKIAVGDAELTLDTIPAPSPRPPPSSPPPSSSRSWPPPPPPSRTGASSRPSSAPGTSTAVSTGTTASCGNTEIASSTCAD